MPSLLFDCFSPFLPHLRTLAQEKRSQKLSSFWDWWAESLFVSIIVAKYNISPLANKGQTTAARAKKKKKMANRFAHAMHTLSAGTIEILSTLTYTEAPFTRLRTNFCTDKKLHGSTLRLHGTGGTGGIFERLSVQVGTCYFEVANLHT